jgi:hypothetical protein
MNENMVAYAPENDELFEQQATLRDVSSRIIRSSFSGNELAGEKLTYRWNGYGQLGIRLGSTKVKKTQLQVIFKELLNDYMVRESETIYGDGLWYTVEGYLTVGRKGHIKGRFLLRGNYVVGYFKDGSKIERTIKWWNKHVFNQSATADVATYTRDFKPEFHGEDDIYSTQYPEFTREDELNEIGDFLTSLSGRRLSPDEELILRDIKAQLDSMLA